MNADAARLALRLAALLRKPWVQLALLLSVVSLVMQFWTQQREHSLGEQLAAELRPGDLRMISSQNCAICTQARRWFQAHRVSVSECLVERDAACRAEFEALGAPGTPVMVVKGQPQLGFNPQALLAAAERPAR